MNHNTAFKRKNEEDSYDNKENVFMKSATEGDLSPAIGCSGLKMRHSNSDSPHHQSSAAAAIARLFNFFHSKSDSNIKSGSKSDSTIKPSSVKLHSKTKTRSSSQSPTEKAPRRRFVRVVRDSEAQAPEKIDDNPHVICRYSQQFLEEHYRKSQEQSSSKPLPYIASGHTILKKSSTDPTPCDEPSPAVGKHATFKELVEIIEFSGHSVLDAGEHISHEERLHDDELEPLEDSQKAGFFLRHDSAGEADLECELEADALQAEDEVDEVTAKVPAVDLNRMDGIMKNIFSSVANVHESHSSPEPAKIRRIELSELVHQFDADEQNEIAKSEASS